MKTTVLVFVDRENTSMGMRIASQEEFTQILIKNKELPLQERRLFTKDVIADTDGFSTQKLSAIKSVKSPASSFAQSVSVDRNLYFLFAF